MLSSYEIWIKILCSASHMAFSSPVDFTSIKTKNEDFFVDWYLEILIYFSCLWDQLG